MWQTLRRELGRIPAWSSRRAVRAAITAPIAFGLAGLVMPPSIALFAAFGSVIQLLFVEFTGPGRQARTVLFTITTTALVALGSLMSTDIVVAALGIAVIAFCISLTGVVSPAIATGTPAALFVLTLAGTVPASIDTALPRLAAWGIASAGVIVATTVILPAPDIDPLWSTAMGALDRLRRGVRGGPTADRVTPLRTALLTTPHQPGALSRRQRRLVGLTDRVLHLTEALDRVAVAVSGNDALPAWIAAQLDALSSTVGAGVPAIEALPLR
ncbi:hypothetical protein AX769_17315 [Frondihabitans sp. PAMC 28766]|uniref:hypothetical protein n=1 Tax=Frondihabitans sp. PAMC 28766 TaxID=1795630 RepID=UPI00078B5D6F|nr:hypothetical protein [Frondihabitans sp. PAMC 28766]AMM21577.1 hypothetical protein AX769_17315 [Frondihabitans sp. PAMC 28766]